MFSSAECLVLAHDDTSNGEREISEQEARQLATSGLYQPSTGSPATAQHWRRSLPDRSCLHLVIDGSSGRLHHDAHDPHASLMSLCLHMTHEARTEAVELLALGWAAVSLLAR
ncbi:MAG: hypothetical protein E6Q67_00365 [Roseateles sp.]|nr:MAG: hypothetical protein E6Q67_00365 [Roseateles sp.]